MTRHIRWQIVLILAGMVMVAILLTYLAVEYTTEVRPGFGGTYVEALVGYPRHFNPLLCSRGDIECEVCSLLFGSLTHMTESGEVEPELARGWDVSPDGLSYTFLLRNDVTWHDGTPFTAADVIFTIRMMQDPSFPGPAELGVNLWQVVEVDKVDDYRVRFTLSETYAPFLDYTTFGILPAHLLAGTAGADLPTSPFNMTPVGTGPFQIEEIEMEQGVISSVLLQRYPDHYLPRPYLDRVQFKFYPSHQTALAAYEVGEVEGVARIPILELERARQSPDLTLFSAPMAQMGVLFLNQDREDLPFFQEEEVRRALLYAIDREEIVREAFDGYGLVPVSPLLPGSWAYTDDLPPYDHNPGMADLILDSAGWEPQEIADGLRRKDDDWLVFDLLASSDPRRAQAAHMMAEQWATHGITVNVQTASALEVRQALETREYDAVLIELALPGDPDPYPFWHETQATLGQNYSGYSNRRMSEIVEQARVTVDRQRRLELYLEFQQLFAQELPALPIYIPIYTYGVDARIHNVQIGPMVEPSDRFRTLADWWIVPRRVFVSGGEEVAVEETQEAQRAP